MTTRTCRRCDEPALPGLERCKKHEHLRKYHRNRARAKREREWKMQTAGCDRCPKRVGPGRCGGPLRDYTDGNGRVLIKCLWCDRKKAGICRDCARPVDGKVGYSLRCAEHKRTALVEHQRRFREEHRDEVRARARRYYQENESRRERRKEYKRLYRAAHPEQVKKEKYRFAVSEGAGRKHHLEYHKKYNRKLARKLRKRALAKLEYYKEHPVRPVPKCAGCARYLDWIPKPNGAAGAPPKWCDDCAPKYEKQRRARIGRSIKAVDEPPEYAFIPPLSKLIKEAGRDRARTCLTPGCEAVLTGRRKKCDRCKEIARREALQKLGEVAA